jgi:CubicO group peptidase (beta-lactamase class C family)
MNATRNPSLGAMVLATLVTLLAGNVFASASDSLMYHAPAGAPQPLEAIGPTTPIEMEAFIDGFMQSQMRAGPVAGATVAVVKDGALFFSKGYGFADVEKRAPVDPAQTLFRPGSVSKLFTWTAVMQLVEAGKLDLDADVNTYLKDIQIPKTFDKPITLRNIMTHTTGFEDGGVGYLFADSAKTLVPLGTWLKEHMPARIRPPTTDFTSGANASYSNYATALAGHIIATVSGQPFDEYIEQHIFKPLGMNHSSFREPLPPELEPHMSGGYNFENGEFVKKGYEFIHAAGPAGSLASTATDMARFMLAYLQNGALDDGRILKEETAKLMTTRTMSPDPALNGSALGFYETWINGRRVIGHGGDTLYFHSEVVLVPEANLGLFVSINTGGEGARTSMALQTAFVSHYFPATLPVIKPPADAQERNQRYAGTYRSLRHSYTKFERVFAATGDVKATPMPDGTLLMPDPLFGKPSRWIEVGNGVFRDVNQDLFLAFKGDNGGHTTQLVGPFSPIASERIHWYETGKLHGFVAGIAILLIITTIVSAIRQRRADRSGPPAVRWARPVLALAGALLLIFLIVLALVLAAGLEALIFKVPSTLYVALTFALLAVPAALVAAYFAVKLWSARAWSLGARVHYTLATLAVLSFLLILHYWNLIGYRIG